MEQGKSAFIQSRQAQAIYANAIPSASGILIIAAASAYGLSDAVPAPLLSLWTIWMLCTALLRIRLRQQYLGAADRERTPAVWTHHFTINTALAGIGWGGLCLLLPHTQGAVYQSAIILILLGVMGASVPLLSAYLPAFIASSMPSALILPLMLVTQLQETALLLTGAMILFLTLIYYITVKSSRDRIRGYTLEHEKNTLLERLNAEVERRRLTQDQLEYHQKHLEHLIEERTLQLEQSNRELNREIEERKQTQQALQVSEERFRIAGKAAYDLIFEWDVAAGSIEWHGDIDGILHYPTGEVSATLHTWLERIHPDDIDAYREIIERYRSATDPLRLQHRVRHHDGGYRHWSNHAIPILDGQGRPSRWIGVCTDITEQIEHQRQLEYAAHHDILTNLPNRILLADRLQQALTQAERRHARLMVAYLDLDGFKEINDAHGHSIGDHLLINLASRLHEILREGDTIARLGGDEFVLVLLDVQEGNERASLLRRILDTTSQPVVIDDKPLQVSGSLGVTVYPQPHEVNADQLLRQADQAMYQAKLLGKNRYHLFDTEHDQDLRGHQEHLLRIYQGMVKEEFILHYQPKVNMHSGELIGVEALVRWQHPQEGVLPPSFFLPAIAEQPFAIELGEWVIDQALTQVDIWLQAGHTIPVSVNIGAYQLQQPEFITRLRKLLAAHPRVDPGLLELEVLETSALADIYKASRIMHACQKIGVRFALDDFGTGYSSLAYLKHLPAATLKIDRTFVRDMLDDPDDLAILEGIIGMAAAFRRRVIAEGVESVAHGDLLLKLGCDLAQGYSIAHPMPPGQLLKWVAGWHPHPSWTRRRRIDRDHLSLLFAAIEHRAWVRHIEEYLGGVREAPPELRHTACRFGLWLTGEAQQEYGGHTEYTAILSLHQQVHETGRSICRDHEQNRPERAREALTGLRALRDTLLQRLDRLSRQPHGETPGDHSTAPPDAPSKRPPIH
ncbi:MAG: hypothetical protein B0D96_09550 [Candidatus Sedimenticola endophacoides]|nr:MAG: hypothetical protein B0D94_03770 [Candidatus Sedimenticola endophacoides]OQX34358.1 MAG: hypothetical protein B0D96_09550 [Candidatus Sedimenticola endophacoides]OQX41519.1 MAG: hypothetical protein B0D89_03825 [Candidatus Sedimenticola endophacoides]PUD99578.1 MAG: hypothetical protein C3L26_08600 [Candidatus Sedimenticola endophacoides]PUE03199.1 MAG: hypothetical protein C3L25_08590 [Candidatus Sedimenticola endophacoides]